MNFIIVTRAILFEITLIIINTFKLDLPIHWKNILFINRIAYGSLKEHIKKVCYIIDQSMIGIFLPKCLTNMAHEFEQKNGYDSRKKRGFDLKNINKLIKDCHMEKETEILEFRKNIFIIE